MTDEAGLENTDTDNLDEGPSLRACLEAILLVADEPVQEVLIAQVIERPRGR
jgi:segregation and condensation protein B